MSNRLPSLRLLAAGLLALSLTLLVGCQSAKQPGSGSHASVQIPGRSLAEVQKTVTAVFSEEGYALTPTGTQEIVFERLGSREDALKWGGWWGEGVIMRVKVLVSELTNGSYLLQADAYAVQNSKDDFFRTESRTMLLNRKPYQQLLDETARRLK
jgi:hypothetical protein